MLNRGRWFENRVDELEWYSECIGSRRGARRISEGVVYVQASFNNTNVTVTNVWGWIISWSSVCTFGFKDTSRGTPFVVQTATTNAIHTVVDQGSNE